MATFFTMASIRQANALVGHHFFEAQTMRFFRSRICGRPYAAAAGGAYFVTSECGPSGERRYTVRHAATSGECETAQDAGHTFQEYAHRTTAIAAAKRAARTVSVAS